MMFLSMLSLAFLGVALTPTGVSLVPSSTASAADGVGITPETLKGPVDAANALVGTNVTVDFEIDGDGDIYVQTEGKTDGESLASTPVVDEGTDELDDDWTVMIELYPAEIAEHLPSAADNAKALEEVLVLILTHEFRHVATGDGGKGRKGRKKAGDPKDPSDDPDDCEHLEDLKADQDLACSRISVIQADSEISNEDKCEMIQALCQYIDFLRSIANTPLNVGHAQASCPEVISNGSIVENCGPCGPFNGCGYHVHTYAPQE